MPSHRRPDTARGYRRSISTPYHRRPIPPCLYSAARRSHASKHRRASIAPLHAVLPLQRSPTLSCISTAGPTPSCSLSGWPPLSTATSSTVAAFLPGPTSPMSTTKAHAAVAAIWIGAACGWARASMRLRERITPAAGNGELRRWETSRCSSGQGTSCFYYSLVLRFAVYCCQLV
ncbi:hypothetical protein VPH35_110969 [Triticum aestivum]|uniref:uncharacterized protein isoform X1 n=1 Tax=Triticum aestivum TaxID=4565 RepID=UPI001D02CBF4|nr:uncharacterized protein LOC123137234 isoform X1 [Triticum aestivum]